MGTVLYIGLISGTSRDGVDAALVNIEGDRPELLHAFCKPYPPAIQKDLENLLEPGTRPDKGKSDALDDQLGRFFARTANELIEQAGIERHDVCAIGSHGQTTWHAPDAARPVSIQLGNGSIIARATGATTVTDFRKADIRAGGQGAPLAPLLHRELFQSENETRVVLNLGGIANITTLEPGGAVSGYDCGPGNCLMDAWIQKEQGQAFDRGGGWAASGELDEQLLDELLDDPYFSLPAPKSTGVEYFNLAWLQSVLGDRAIEPANLQCTLAEFTARSVAQSIRDVADASRVLVCGGGVHNSYLMFRLKNLLDGTPVESTAAHGADPDWVEAILFAWLAKQRLEDLLQDTRAITGAREPVLLGRIYESGNSPP